ncbi:glycoside hydrolase superfamily [Obelidium mucronatum]|nr:glycoside hydrolase superfamily [Obelidium mucronatum]
MGVNTRNHLCFALFWAKVVLALFLSLGGLLYLVYLAANLHSNAINPNSSNINRIVFIDPKTGLPVAACAHDPTRGLARLEADTQNKIMTGYLINWENDQPSKMIERLKGYKPPVFNFVMRLHTPSAIGNLYKDLAFDNETLDSIASECGRTGTMLELTLLPELQQALDQQIQEVYDSVATALSDINRKYGVPVFLRYAPEMNGNWKPYGMQPLRFIKSFRAMAVAIRSRTNMTAMVWAPVVGLAYPNFGFDFIPPPQPGGSDFLALDTDHNGVINDLDDPYTPFYPGDEYVDWVGLTLLYYPLPGCHNCAVPETFFRDYLTGSGPIAKQVASNVTPAFTLVHDFYNMFSGDQFHKKPLMLPETGAPFLPAWANYSNSVNENTIKMSWWNQVLSTDTLKNFPKLKMVFNREEELLSDPLQEGNFVVVDWKVTNTTSQLEMWLPIINGFKTNMLESSQLKYSCDGSIRVV